MASDLALLDRPVGDRQGDGDSLRLVAGGTAWSVPVRSVRGIAEAGPVLPFPLIEPPIAGFTELDGRPLLLVDPCGRAGPAGRRLVVEVATQAGGIALAVDVADRGGAAPPLDIAGLIPWSGGFAEAGYASRKPVGTKTSVPLMLVRSEGETIALRTERLVRVERPVAAFPLSDGDVGGDVGGDVLLDVGGTLLAARPLGGSARPEGGFALVLRGDDGRRAALLVERALGVRTCPAERLVPVSHPAGGRSLWWHRDGEPPLRVVDPADLLGWAPAAPVAASDGAESTSRAAEPPGLLFVEVAGMALAIPLPLVRQVDEPPAMLARSGPGKHVLDLGRLLAGRAAPPPGGGWLTVDGPGWLLRADRILPLAAPAIDWQGFGAVPAVPAALFDAAGWDGERSRWVLRLRADALRPESFVLMKRRLAVARIGRAVIPIPPASGPKSR